MQHDKRNTKNEEGLLLNKRLPYTMHIDLNSCFAIIEQQANRLLRGKPVGISAYDTPRGFVVAASYEAKAMGVVLGVNVEQARALAPGIIIMTPDPAKYREAHRLFKAVLLEYSPDVTPKSIDEFILSLEHSPVLVSMKNEIRKISNEAERLVHNQAMLQIGEDIKSKIAKRLGEWVTVNIGISTNKFLAKYAAGFDKPNGMTLIDHINLRDYYRCRSPYTCASFGATMRNTTRGIDIPSSEYRNGQAKNSQEPIGVSGFDGKQDRWCGECGGMKLVDLPGINTRYRARLRARSIYTPLDFLDADMHVLKKQVFKSINGYHWYMRLRGYETDTVEFSRKSIGHQHALSNKTMDTSELECLLLKLCEKTGRRLRKNNYYATGIHLYLGFVSEYQIDGPSSFENIPNIRSWHHGEKVLYRLYSTSDIYKAAKRLLHTADIPNNVKIMSVHVFGLQPWDPEQLSIFDNMNTKIETQKSKKLPIEPLVFRSQEAQKRISDSVDAINNRYGEFVITPAMMLDMQGTILDRIAFGQVKDL